jgi:hypothetical protein
MPLLGRDASVTGPFPKGVLLLNAFAIVVLFHPRRAMFMP